MTGSRNVYFPELDGLRFLAFLLVFIHHAPPLITPHLLKPVEDLLSILHQYGWMGVDLFLCLSAFLFTKLLFVEHKTKGDINIKNFYIRRLLRIWPLYYIFITIMAMMTLSSSGWNGTIVQRGLGMVTFTDNIFSAVFSSYNPFFASGHLWTISYEEQFYAIIPWLLGYLFKMSSKGKGLVVSALFVFFTSVQAYMIYHHAIHPAIWVLPVTHFESILGGIIIGLGWFDYLKKIPASLLMLCGIALLAWVCHLPNLYVISWYLMLTYLFIGLGMSLIVYAVMQGNILKNIFQKGALTYLGKISYGLYVYHVLALEYATLITKHFNINPERILVFPLVTFIVGLCLTILFSVISYHFLEKPFLHYKEKFTAIQSRPI